MARIRKEGFDKKLQLRFWPILYFRVTSKEVEDEALYSRGITIIKTYEQHDPSDHNLENAVNSYVNQIRQ